jgi:long-chain acyl-CoA synthetase
MGQTSDVADPKRPPSARAAAVPTHDDTLVSCFLARVAEAPDAEALRYVPIDLDPLTTSRVATLTRRELAHRARALASGLLARVAEPGARCAILCETRPEWVIADLACTMAGLITVPLFPNIEPATLALILDATDCRLALVENPWQARKLLDLAPTRKLQFALVDPQMTLASGATVTLEEVGATPASTFAALVETRPSMALEERLEDAAPDACVTLCPTLGTEGQVKLVTWTHANLVASASNLADALRSRIDAPAGQPRLGRADAPTGHALLLALPLAQSLGRAALWAGLIGGIPLALPRSEPTTFEDLPHLSPSLIFGVPSLFSRAREHALAAVRARGLLPGLASRWATAAPDPGLLGRLKSRVADGLLRPELRRRFGPAARVLVASGAPLDPDVQAFYLRHGLPLRQAYGLVETTGPTHLDVASPPRVGTVGPPMPGLENRLAIDGELLVRGPQVTPGYWRDPEATRRALDSDGWLLTGDLGTLAPDGTLAITGRKRDVIVLDNGRIVAPLPIERQLTAHPLVAQAMVHGDKRPFATVLLALDPTELQAFAEAENLAAPATPEAFATLSRHPKVHSTVNALIAEVNQSLPAVAQLRKFAILPSPLPATDLTEAQTLKRSLVASRHQSLLDSFYAESY